MTTELAPSVAEQAPEARRTMPAWVTRERVARTGVLGTLIALAAAFYTWTVNTSGSPIVFGQGQSDYYNQLSDAFLHGHIYLLTQPPAALLKLKNPYDPGQNIALAGPYHDLALYHGHFYLTWGPTAALTLFIPWRILHVGDMSQSLAIVIFSVVGLLFAVLLLCFVVRTFMSRVPLWKLAVATIALALSSVEPYLMRRPAQYEVCISCAYCFAFAGMFGLVSGSFGPRRRPWRIGVGGLCLGLAVLSREDLIILAAFPAGLALREWWLAGRPPLVRALRGAVAMLVPFAAVLVVLFAYNAARFGSPLQVGTSYQLASVDQQHAFVYQPSSILPGLYYYFVEPVQYTLAFPYFLIGPPPYYPFYVANYAQTEQLAGVLTTTPILTILFVAPFLLRRRLTKPLGWLMASFALAGFTIALAIAFGIPGTTMRYEADFATLLLIPALVCWFALSEGSRWYRRVLSVIGTILVFGGALAGMAISIVGQYDEMRQFDTAQYNEIASTTSFVPTLITKLMGHPDIAKDVYLCGNGECGAYAAGLSHWTFDAGNTVECDVISPSGGWYLQVEVFPATKGDRNDAFTVQLDSRTWHYRTASGARDIYVPLHSGMDRIYFTVPGKMPVSFFRLRTVQHLAPDPLTAAR